MGKESKIDELTHNFPMNQIDDDSKVQSFIAGHCGRKI